MLKMWIRHTLALLVMLLAGSAAALQVDPDEVRWGFNGRIVPGRVNLLSVRVFNDSGIPFDGALRLERRGGVGGRIGAVQAQPLYVTPFTERWVQFPVLLPSGSGECELSWGRSAFDRLILDIPREGSLAQVVLDMGRAVGSGKAPVRRFPADLFPATLAACESLHSVILDGVPRWEAPRRAAFMQWLQRGGRVMIVNDPDGRRPSFGGDLAALNVEGDTARVGGGYVWYQPTRLSQLRARDLVRMAAPELKKDTGSYMSDFASPIFSLLRKRTAASHNWVVIYLLIALYVGLIGPVNGWVARRKSDYRPALLLFGGCVLVFTLLFTFVGRRGYGEQANLRSVALAHSLGDGTYDVTQWGNAFVTRSGQYEIRHEAPNNIYASGQEDGGVAGVIQSGPGGVFGVEIPLFSSMPFVHRARIPGPRLDTALVALDQTKTQGQLRLSLNPDIAREAVHVYAYRAGVYYTLARKKDEFVSSSAQVFDEFLPENERQRWMYGQSFGGRRDKKEKDFDPTEDYSVLSRIMCARAVDEFALMLYGHQGLSPGKDRVRVCVFAEGGANLHASGDDFGLQETYVLYVEDVLL